MGLLATALACLAMSPGCGGPAVEASPSATPFALTYERSGGLKATPQKLTIGPGRHAIATIADTRGGTKTVRFQIPRKRVQNLRQGLAQAHFSQLESPPPGNCADCYLYSISYRGHEVTVGQADMSDRLDDVVTELETLIHAHAVPPG